MALTKEVIEDKIEVVGPFKIIQVLTVTVVSEDGVELSRSNHRHSINPNDDTSNESADVQAMVAHFHTQAIKDAYTAHMTPAVPADGE